MGILNNGFRDAYGTFRFAGSGLSGGTTPSALLSSYHLPGAQRNRVNASAAMDNASFSVPDGVRPPYTWIMPQKSARGGMSSRTTDVEVAATGLAYMGFGLEGSASVSMATNAPVGELIAFGVGAAMVDVTTNAPLLTASINGAGSSSFAVTTGTPILGAIASLVAESAITVSGNTSSMLPEDDSSPLRTASATLTITGSLERYAVGHMEGSALPYTELSPQSLAGAVWSQVLEAGYTAEEIVRILAAVAAGSATGLEGSDPQFLGLDGSTVRVDGTYLGGTRTIDTLNGA